MNNPQGWNFQHTYKTLPDTLYSIQEPTPVSNPQMVCFNETLATQLGLGFLNPQDEHAANIFSGNTLPEGAAPISQAYAGHQFGYFTMLGDGRAVLLGEQLTPEGKRYDIQLKGSGPTPYSRRGDGRATLSAVLREYLMSEAMHHLGIPTSRSLAVVSTGEKVYRAPVQDGGILTRVASSHIRVGTFEFVRQYGSPEDLEQLTDYVIKRHYPALIGKPDAAIQLLRAVIQKQVDLVAQWVSVGFIHGVMNTDNMSIAGETIDYGPCAFMNTYDPATVFSSIDTQGRYAFGNQPRITHWNLGVLAGALLPLIAEEEEEAIALAKKELDQFPALFARKWYNAMGRKLGIQRIKEQDRTLVDGLLDLMKKHKADFTNLFLALTYQQDLEEAIFQADDFKAWREQWAQRIKEEGAWAQVQELMIRQNPAFIARNHLVEEALDAATLGNMVPFEELLNKLAKPYEMQADNLSFQGVPAGFDQQYQTFCGT
jgi:uncharacterized protein YdiU (UPF0061 family)